MRPKKTWVLLTVFFVCFFVCDTNNASTEQDCIWPLTLKGNTAASLKQPFLSTHTDFLRDVSFGFFNTRKTSDNFLSFDGDYVPQLVMGNILYQRKRQAVFRLQRSENTRGPSLRLLQLMVEQLQTQMGNEFSLVYRRASEQLWCSPLGKSFSLINPREHPLAVLGRILPDDILLVKLQKSGDGELIGGFVAYPLGWDLNDKVGKSVSQIHASVYADEVGADRAKYKSEMDKISLLFKKEVDVPLFRNNWFLVTDPTLAQFPDSLSAFPPRLNIKTVGKGLFLRMEREIFLRFSFEGQTYLAMLIRPFQYPLSEVAKYPQVARGLVSGLQEPLTAYRGQAYNALATQYLKNKIPWAFE